MRYDAEHKQRTHQKVVHEAAKAIRLHGPDKMGIATLMSQVGLTHGGFYAHFQSKDDLIAEAISHMFDERAQALRKCTEGLPPAQGLENHIDTYLSTKHRDHRDIGCPLVALSGDLARMPPTARKRFEAGVQGMYDAVATLLEAMQHPDAEALSRSMVTEMVGAMTVARAVSTDLSARILRDARASVKARAGLPTRT